MSEPDKKDFDRDLLPPVPVPDTKCLHPLFGTYCRTETFMAKEDGGAQHHLHAEAHMDDPVAKTWTVTKVVLVKKAAPFSVSPHSARTVTHAHQVKAKVTFKEALETLSEFEKKCREKPAVFTPTYPDAAAMGFSHYKAFAEREGYIFDASCLPHARPRPDALPPGFSFRQEDIDSSARNLARPDSEFDNNGPASKTPNTLFLLDHFTRAAHGENYSAALTSLRVLNILDRFIDQVDKGREKLEAYCASYQELGHGDLIAEAEASFAMAEASVRQLKAYGVDTASFESFVLQCQISASVLHAEGLYDLMNKGKGDFESNEALFKSRVNQAMDAYKNIDGSDEGLRILQNMIVQTPELKVPDAIGQFVNRYKKSRGEYTPPDPRGAAGQKPKPPKP